MRPWQRRAREEDIRALAAAQLADPQDDFNPLDYLGELAELSPPKSRSIHNLEATLILCVGAQIRPTRTRQAMGFLRVKYDEANDPDGFTKFETYLKQATGSDVLLGHDFAPTSFSSMDHKAVWDKIGDVFGQLDALTDDLFLNSGTLLGVIRDKALIEHDDDVDLAVRLPASSPEEAAKQWIELREKLRALGLFDDDSYSDKAILKVKSDADFEIDLFPSWVQDNKVYVYPHTFGELSESDVYPTKPCAVTGLPIPANPQAMLALNYGDGWKNPDPYFKFPWGPAKRKFETLLVSIKKEHRRV